jgi:tetratricopeptide (TPR) repeat protein
VYGVALKEAGRVDEALAALDKAAAADPEAQVNKQKMAWLVEAGQVEAAAASARAAIEKGEMPAEEVVRYIAGTGWNEKGKQEQHAEAIKYYELAASLAPTAQARAMPNFFWGYAVFKQAIVQQEPSTAASARASLPNFQRAKELLQAASGYQEQEATRQNLISQVNDYIAIQEALIKRGR